MKSFVLAFLLATCILSAGAQYPKLIVRLKDKGGSSYRLNDPSQYLSLRAIVRRTRFGIAIDSTDLPVSGRYLDSIRLAGNVTILGTSKWLNQVLIQTTDQIALAKINTFPFVLQTKAAGYRSTNNRGRDKFKELPVTEPANRQNKTYGTDVYNYGNNYNQVHIHEGEFLHNKGYHGENIQITLLDAGFNQYKTVTAFDSVRLNNQVLGERDFVAYDNSVNEDDTHGMYCLSTLCANWPGKMIGTAPKASYWLIRTENGASEYPIEEHNWVAGAEFADSAGSDMISSSLGYSTFDDAGFNHTYDDFYKNTTTVSKGAAIAVAKGMIVTNSAGNEGNSTWKYLIFPADDDSVCTVGSVKNSGIISGFSSYGYPGKVKPDIVSVGEGAVVAGLNNQPGTLNGTSFSNPNVAGLIACLWQAFPAVSNMKILDAVYKSADRFAAPDNRYGYGIPDFKIAYQLLKHDENIALSGSEWLFVTPATFTNQLAVKFIGRINGSAALELINAAGQAIAAQSFTTEKEETYTYSFANLANLPAGLYSVRYADSTTNRSIQVEKQPDFEKDWLTVLPNPFKDELVVSLKSPEQGEADIRLLDSKGSLLDKRTLQVSQNQILSIHFSNLQPLAHGIYFVQYLSKNQKRTIRLLK